MEQNQSQQQVQIQQNLPTQQQQWQKIRNQFATNEQSISQTEDVIALIQKWIWIQYEQQFKQFEKKLQQRSDINRNIKDILSELIQQQKHASWMINQKYSMEQVNELIAKLRQQIVTKLNTDRTINPQAIQHQIKQKNTGRKAMASTPNQQENIDKRLFANYSSVLPQIKPKGKIYHPKQMSSSFHISKQTQQDYQIRSPYMFQREKKLIQAPKESLFNNKYLKMAFKGFCKQGYNSNGLFQDISKDADKMTLNKWMIFCKEFSFIDKFHKSQLVSIYNASTKFSSVMYLQDFLTAVALLQQKHINKFHTGQYNFVAQVLKIGNEASFKVKMDNLKVSYAGPRRNFFEYATYSQGERADEIQKQKVYQVKKKERQIVLIKGMFEDHLKDQIQQLKTQRETNKGTSRLGYSLNKIENKKHNLDQSKHNIEQASNTKSSRIKNMNYSKLFQINRGQTTNKKDHNYTTSITNKESSIGNMYKTQLKNDSKLIQHTKIEAKTFKNSNNQIKPPVSPLINKQKIIHEDKLDTTWLTKIRTDSEQSDQILKQHLMIQKRMKKVKESSKAQDIMAEMSQRARQVERIKQEIQKQNQEDNDMVQTQLNFNKEREGTRV